MFLVVYVPCHSTSKESGPGLKSPLPSFYCKLVICDTVRHNLDNQTNDQLSNIKEFNFTDSLSNVQEFVIQVDPEHEIGYIAFEKRLKWFYV